MRCSRCNFEQDTAKLGAGYCVQCGTVFPEAVAVAPDSEAPAAPVLPENVIQVNFRPEWMQAIVEALKNFKRHEVVEDLIGQGFHPSYVEVVVRRCMARVLRMGKKPS